MKLRTEGWVSVEVVDRDDLGGVKLRYTDVWGRRFEKWMVVGDSLDVTLVTELTT